MPFVLLVGLNSVIIYKANLFARSQRDNVTHPMASNAITDAPGSRRKAQMTKTILTITFIYIILELPCSIITGYFYFDIISLDGGYLYQALVNNIQFSFSAFNFFILYFSNKLFKKAVDEVFGLARQRLFHQRTETNLMSENSTRKKDTRV